MLKRALQFVFVFTFSIFIMACSSENDADSGQSVDSDVEVSVFTATIIEMIDEPRDDWYDSNATVLVDGVRGRMIFDHRRLEDIGATVGDVVEITVTGAWVEPDPAPIYPDSWSLVE